MKAHVAHRPWQAGQAGRFDSVCRAGAFGWLLSLVFAAAAFAEAPGDPDPAGFESRVRPILVGACFRCHGPGKSSGDFHIESRQSLLQGGPSGPAIVPGDPDGSLLVRAIRRQEGVSAMPPDAPLSSAEVQALTEWVQQGAPWPQAAAPLSADRHWAFQPVSVTPPAGEAESELAPIDAYLRARQQAAGVAPAPEADRRTLIRRASFVLTGLPPSPEEVAALESDSSPEAFARMVDRLLDSPHYGEQMGRHWLDVVRYADTAGENTDHPLPHAWKYRNWVISAFNRDMPYDEFLKRQIAGDLLASERPPEQYADCVVATGYLAIARRFGHDIDKDMHLTLEDVIDTLGKSVLGLSLGCARCHDHKFDPITSRDYYGLYGIFESTRFAFPGCEPKQQPRDLVPLISPQQYQQLIQPRQQALAELDAQIEARGRSLTLQAKAIQEQAQSGELLSEGTVEDGLGRNLFDQPMQLSLRAGDTLVLEVAPRGNHGADTTLVEWSITDAGGKCWSTRDLVDDLLAGNPHTATGAQWCFLDARDGYALLPEKLAATDGRSELKVWRNGDTPSAFVNTADEPVPVWTTLPPKSFFVHPGSAGPVAVAWTCPAEMSATIAGRIADAHPGGDGVSWKLRRCGGVGEALAKLAGQTSAQQAALLERSELAAELSVPVAYGVTEGESRNARLHQRGDPNDPGEEVPRKFLDILGGQTLQAAGDSQSKGDSQATGSGRKQLALWLTDPANPLTARVIVNRVWQWHFGRGLVATPNDFGVRGSPPSHPELLDYLADCLVRDGWRLKPLHRRIMLSQAWRQASAVEGEDSSPAAELFALGARRRLTAEELRDSLLAVSGQLDRTPGEAHPFPPEASWTFTQHAPFAAEYPTQKRSVYVMQKRNRRDRFFALFDGADPNASTARRDSTTVPTQALYFLNDPFVHDCAAKIAAAVLDGADENAARENAPRENATDEDAARVDFACRLLFGRPASADDLSEFQSLKAELAGLNVVWPEEVWKAYARVLIGANEFLYID